MSYDNLAKHHALVPKPRSIFQPRKPLLTGHGYYLVGTSIPKLQAKVLK